MRNIPSILLLGSIIITFFGNIRTVEKSCVVKTVNQEKHAECTHLNASDVPANLDPDIKSLAIVHCTLEAISSKSIVHYTNVETLKLISSWIKIAMDETFLNTFTNLKTLIMEVSSVPTRFFLKLPDSLENITLATMKLNDINISHPNLLKLKYLDLNHNYMTSFPILNTSYPLETIILDDNPLIVINMVDIVPFCGLKYLGVNALSSKKYQPDQKDAICRCLRLQWFVRREKIKTNFDKNPCTNATIGNCSLELDPESLKIREKCPIKPEESIIEQQNFWYYVVSGIVIASLVVIVATTIAVNKWIRGREEQKDSSEYEDTIEGESESVSEEAGEEE